MCPNLKHYLQELLIFYQQLQVKTVPTSIWIGMDVPLIFEFGVEWIWIQLYGLGWKWG